MIYIKKTNWLGVMIIVEKFSVIIVLFLLIIHVYCQNEDKRNKQPKVILHMTDNLGYGDVGNTGKKKILRHT